MVGRQTPILAVFVPLVLVFIVDGKRGVRQTWLAGVVGGVAFAIAQFVAANYISVPLTDIIASLVSAAAVVGAAAGVAAGRSPRTLAEPAHATRRPRAAVAARPPARRLARPPGEPSVARRPGDAAAPATASGAPGRAPVRDHRGEVVKAYAPYLIIIAIFSIANLGPVKAVLAEAPWTVIRLAGAERLRARRGRAARRRPPSPSTGCPPPAR